MPKILIADDEPYMRRLLKETLEIFEEIGPALARPKSATLNESRFLIC